MNNGLLPFDLHPLLQHLVQRNHLHEKKARFLNEKRQHHFHLTQFILKEQWLTQSELLALLLTQSKLEHVSIRQVQLSEVPSALSIESIKKCRVLPLRHDKQRLELGVTDPFNELILQCVRFQTRSTLILKLMSDEEFDVLIQHKTKPLSWNEIVTEHILQDEHYDFSPTEEDLDTPLIEFIQQLILHCNQHHASDIHLNPLQDHYLIRTRIHGELTELAAIPHHLAKRVISGLKILAHVDITEKRLPQDGRFQIDAIQNMHIRAAFCPSLFGEKAVLRLLRQNNMEMTFAELGLSADQQSILVQRLHQKEGLIIVCGATGAGKTTSLYAMLNYLNQQQKHICTIEHPVEYVLPGATQLNVQHHLGFDFANGLRALLRHDPDVILIGEIRDQETAVIAMQAAETGHLVLASLHATNAIAAYFRFKHLIHDHTVSLRALSLIVGQRLINRPLQHSAQFELLPMHAELHDAFRCSDSEIVLKNIARQHGYVSMGTDEPQDDFNLADA